jgi:hypothetical protein
VALGGYCLTKACCGGSRHQEETVTVCVYHHRWLIVIKDSDSGSYYFWIKVPQVFPVPARRRQASRIFPFRDSGQVPVRLPPPSDSLVVCGPSPHFLLNARTLGPEIRTRSEAYCRQGDLPSRLYSETKEPFRPKT